MESVRKLESQANERWCFFLWAGGSVGSENMGNISSGIVLFKNQIHMCGVDLWCIVSFDQWMETKWTIICERWKAHWIRGNLKLRELFIVRLSIYHSNRGCGHEVDWDQNCQKRKTKTRFTSNNGGEQNF